MRILHSYKDYYPVLGGIENHVAALAESQSASGHDVTVLVCSQGATTERETRCGVRIIRAGRLATAFSMPLSLAQPIIAARQRSDIVHVHSPYPLGEITAWLFRHQAKLVITHHSDIVSQKFWLPLYGPLLKRILNRADRIIVTSPPYAESSPWLERLRDRCTVIPLGVDLNRFRPSERKPGAKQRLLFVGRLRYYKGLDTLLLALEELPRAQLTIVGDGPMRESWEALSERLELTRRVRFLGDLDDAEMISMYQEADAFVLPANARSEAFGTVLLEAMACGLPCVTTEVGSGTSWVVEDGVTGLVVRPGDPQTLASALRRLLADPRRRQEMSRASRRRVERQFGRQRMLDGVMRVYEELAPLV